MEGQLLYHVPVLSSISLNSSSGHQWQVSLPHELHSTDPDSHSHPIHPRCTPEGYVAHQYTVPTTLKCRVKRIDYFKNRAWSESHLYDVDLLNLTYMMWTCCPDVYCDSCTQSRRQYTVVPRLSLSSGEIQLIVWARHQDLWVIKSMVQRSQERNKFMRFCPKEVSRQPAKPMTQVLTHHQLYKVNMQLQFRPSSHTIQLPVLLSSSTRCIHVCMSLGLRM